MIDIKEVGFLARVASKEIGVATSAIKNEVLKIAADEIIRKTDEILKANHDDLLEGKKKDFAKTFLNKTETDSKEPESSEVEDGSRDTSTT